MKPFELEVYSTKSGKLFNPNAPKDIPSVFVPWEQALELQKRIKELENYIRMTENVIG